MFTKNQNLFLFYFLFSNLNSIQICVSKKGKRLNLSLKHCGMNNIVEVFSILIRA